MKTYKNIYLSALAALSLVGCTSAPKPEVTTYSFDSITKTQNVVNNLDDLFNVEVIDLEFNDQSAMSTPTKIIRNDDYIFVLSADSGILQFGADGEFIRKISANGQSGSEYMFVSDIAIDNQNNRIYLCDAAGKMLEFDFEGNHIANHPLEGGLKSILLKGNGDIYESSQVVMGNENTILTNRKLDGTQQNRIANHFKYKLSPTAGVGAYIDNKALFKLGGEVVYHQQVRDTVFTYDGTKLTPRYAFSFNRDLDSNPVKYFEDRDNIELLYDVSEDSKYIYPVFAEKGWNIVPYMINKQSGDIAKMDIKVDGSNNIFIPRWCYDGTLIDYIDGSDNSNIKVVILTPKS